MKIEEQKPGLLNDANQIKDRVITEVSKPDGLTVSTDTRTYGSSEGLMDQVGGSCITCRCTREGCWTVCRPGEEPFRMSYARIGCPDGCSPGENLHWRAKEASA